MYIQPENNPRRRCCRRKRRCSRRRKKNIKKITRTLGRNCLLFLFLQLCKERDTYQKRRGQGPEENPLWFFLVRPAWNRQLREESTIIGLVQHSRRPILINSSLPFWILNSFAIHILFLFFYLQIYLLFLLFFSSFSIVIVTFSNFFFFFFRSPMKHLYKNFLKIFTRYWGKNSCTYVTWI